MKKVILWKEIRIKLKLKVSTMKTEPKIKKLRWSKRDNKL